MSNLKEMPATLLRLTEEESAEERSRAALLGTQDRPAAQLQDGLDVDVFHVGFLVEMIVRRL